MNHKDIEHLFRIHYSQMYRVAMAILHDEAEAKDAVSDVFVRLLNGKDYMKDANKLVSDDKEAAYLVFCVRNRCNDFLRHKQVKERFLHLLSVEPQPDLLSVKDTEAHFQALTECINTQLTPQTQRVFLLRMDEHLSCKDIAKQLGISESAVYKHLTQGLTKIKEHFNSKEYED